MRFAAGFVLGLFAALLAICAVGMYARAQADTWLTTSIAFYHTHRGGNNERNWGLGLEQDLTERWRLAAGFYRNSRRDESVYAAGVWSFKTGSFRAGVLAGAVTGYTDKVSPLGGLVLSYEEKRWGGNFIVFPKDGGVAGFQLKRRFD